METLPEELRIGLAEYLPTEDIINLCISSRQYQALCHDIPFWAQRAQREFGISRKTFEQTNLNAIQRYLQYRDTMIYPGCEKYRSVDQCFLQAARENNVELLKYFMGKGMVEIDKSRQRSRMGARRRSNISTLAYLQLAIGHNSIRVSLSIRLRLGMLGEWRY
jgi:hypothetical protein